MLFPVQNTAVPASLGAVPLSALPRLKRGSCTLIFWMWWGKRWFKPAHPCVASSPLHLLLSRNTKLLAAESRKGREWKWDIRSLYGLPGVCQRAWWTCLIKHVIKMEPDVFLGELIGVSAPCTEFDREPQMWPNPVFKLSLVMWVKKYRTAVSAFKKAHCLKIVLLRQKEEPKAALKCFLLYLSLGDRESFYLKTIPLWKLII